MIHESISLSEWNCQTGFADLFAVHLDIPLASSVFRSYLPNLCYFTLLLYNLSEHQCRVHVSLQRCWELCGNAVTNKYFLCLGDSVTVVRELDFFHSSRVLG